MAILHVTPTASQSLRSTRKLALAAEILLEYSRVRILLRRRALADTVARLRVADAPAQTASERRADFVPTGIRLAGIIIRTLSPLPTDSRCLMRSLVLLRMLARRGVPSQLVIGVSPSPAFKAHAWVELEGHPLFATGGNEYSRLVEL